jgi:hypothetical protein
MNYGKIMTLLLALHGVAVGLPAKASDALTPKELAAEILRSTTLTTRALSNDPQAALEEILQVDLPYVTLRQAVLKSGWQPIINAQCPENVGNTELCNSLPELDSCGEQTACRMYFEHKASGKKLQVITKGSYEYVLSRQSKLHVFSWKFINPRL